MTSPESINISSRVGVLGKEGGNAGGALVALPEKLKASVVVTKEQPLRHHDTVLRLETERKKASQYFKVQIRGDIKQGVQYGKRRATAKELISASQNKPDDYHGTDVSGPYHPELSPIFKAVSGFAIIILLFQQSFSVFHRVGGSEVTRRTDPSTLVYPSLGDKVKAFTREIGVDGHRIDSGETGGGVANGGNGGWFNSLANNLKKLAEQAEVVLKGGEVKPTEIPETPDPGTTSTPEYTVELPPEAVDSHPVEVANNPPIYDANNTERISFSDLASQEQKAYAMRILVAKYVDEQGISTATTWNDQTLIEAMTALLKRYPNLELVIDSTGGELVSYIYDKNEKAVYFSFKSGVLACAEPNQFGIDTDLKPVSMPEGTMPKVVRGEDGINYLYAVDDQGKAEAVFMPAGAAEDNLDAQWFKLNSDNRAVFKLWGKKWAMSIGGLPRVWNENNGTWSDQPLSSGLLPVSYLADGFVDNNGNVAIRANNGEAVATFEGGVWKISLEPYKRYASADEAIDLGGLSVEQRNAVLGMFAEYADQLSLEPKAYVGFDWVENMLKYEFILINQSDFKKYYEPIFFVMNGEDAFGVYSLIANDANGIRQSLIMIVKYNKKLFNENKYRGDYSFDELFFGEEIIISRMNVIMQLTTEDSLLEGSYDGESLSFALGWVMNSLKDSGISSEDLSFLNEMFRSRNYSGENVVRFKAILKKYYLPASVVVTDY